MSIQTVKKLSNSPTFTLDIELFKRNIDEGVKEILSISKKSHLRVKNINLASMTENFHLFLTEIVNPNSNQTKSFFQLIVSKKVADIKDMIQGWEKQSVIVAIDSINTSNSKFNCLNLR